MIPERTARLVGDDIAAAILESRLRNGGVAVEWDCRDASIVGYANQHHRDTLEALGVRVSNITVSCTRVLTELAWDDTSGPVDDRLIATGSLQSRAEIQAKAAALTIRTRIDPIAIEPDAATTRLLMRFDALDSTSCSVAHLSGEHLDEPGATAIAITSDQGTWLALTVPLANTIEQSVAPIDIAWRLLSHPGVRDLVGTAAPTRVQSDLIRIRPLSPSRRIARSSLILEPVIDSTESLRLDSQIESAIAFSDGIQALFASDRVTTAALSTIGSKYANTAG